MQSQRPRARTKGRNWWKVRSKERREQKYEGKKVV